MEFLVIFSTLSLTAGAVVLFYRTWKENPGQGMERDVRVAYGFFMLAASDIIDIINRGDIEATPWWSLLITGMMIFFGVRTWIYHRQDQKS